MNFTPSSSSASACIRRDQGARQAARVSAVLFRRAFLHRRAAGADRGCRACDPSDRGTGAQHGPEGCRRVGRSDCRCGAARHGSGRPTCSSAISAGGGSTPWRWGCRPIHSISCSPNDSTLLRTVRDIGLGQVDRAPPLKSLFIRQAAGLAGEVPRLLKGEAL